MRCVCSNNSNCNQQSKSNTKYFNLYAEFRFLYFISTPSNHSLLCFWFYLRYKNKYVLFDFYFAKFNFLCFISTPSNCSPICVWFYLRYKNKKNYTKLGVVLSGCFEGCEFPLSFSFSVFLLLLDRNLLSGILHQLCTGLVPVPVMDVLRFSCSLCCAYSWFLRLHHFI